MNWEKASSPCCANCKSKDVEIKDENRGYGLKLVCPNCDEESVYRFSSTEPGESSGFVRSA